jgi:hypothetical protein
MIVTKLVVVVNADGNVVAYHDAPGDIQVVAVYTNGQNDIQKFDIGLARTSAIDVLSDPLTDRIAEKIGWNNPQSIPPVAIVRSEGSHEPIRTEGAH